MLRSARLLTRLARLVCGRGRAFSAGEGIDFTGPFTGEEAGRWWPVGEGAAPEAWAFFVSSRPKWRDPGSYLARSFTGEEAGGTRLGFRTSLGRGDPCTQYSENRHRRGMRDFVPVRTGYGEIYLARSFTGEEAGRLAAGR